MTKLGNATLFGNIVELRSSRLGPVAGAALAVAGAGAALILAAVGAALLMGSSAELSPRNVTGDLLALFAGLLYTGYLIAVQNGARRAPAAAAAVHRQRCSGALMLLPVSLAARRADHSRTTGPSS